MEINNKQSAALKKTLQVNLMGRLDGIFCVEINLDGEQVIVNKSEIIEQAEYAINWLISKTQAAYAFLPVESVLVEGKLIMYKGYEKNLKATEDIINKAVYECGMTLDKTNNYRKRA